MVCALYSIVLPAQYFVSTIDGGFYYLDLESCKTVYLFTLQPPEDYDDAWVSGLTVTPSGRLFGVSGQHLLEINPSTGHYIIRDSTIPLKFDFKPWLAITADDTETLYYGGFGMYQFDVLADRRLVTPSRTEENTFKRYFGSDLTFRQGKFIAYNGWALRFDILEGDGSIQESREFNEFEPLLFNALAIKTGCEAETILAFDLLDSLLYQLGDSLVSYTELCNVGLQGISGFTSIHGGTLRGNNIGFTLPVDEPIFLECNERMSLEDVIKVGDCAKYDYLEVSHSTEGTKNSFRIASQDAIELLRSTDLQRGEYGVTVVHKKSRTHRAFSVLRSCSNDWDRIWLPNAFTPNNDGVNDVLKIFINNPDTQILEMRIFDRLGRMMHYSEDQNPYWSGTDAPSGVYICALKLQTEGNNVRWLYSDVTVVR